MEDVTKLYQERLDRIATTVSHQEPDNVPVMLLGDTWNIGYAGYTFHDLENDAQKQIEAYSSAFKDIYCDAGLASYYVRDVSAFDLLGGGAYFISKDGVTMQHKEYVFMKDDEYPKLVADPMNFTVNEIFPRKYPAFNKPYPENLQVLKEVAKVWSHHVQTTRASANYAKEKYGVPFLCGATAQAPVDMILDFYRGFKGITGDIRRRPEEIIEAAKAMIPMIMAGVTGGRAALDPFPYIFIPLHLPTFISPKHFGSIYWPSFKKLLLQLHQLGGKALIYLEGNWEHLYEFVNEIPKNFAIVLMEKDDIFKAKEKIGDTVTIAGGMPLGMLKAGTKQDCIDHAKKVIDKCAPGGGFIFTTDKIMLTRSDVNIENLKAVHEFVHSYGKYC